LIKRLDLVNLQHCVEGEKSLNIVCKNIMLS